MDIDPTLPDQEDAPQVMPHDGPENIYDENDEYSVVNLVSERLAQAIRSVPPELHDLTEGELRAKVNPTQTEFQLRTSFWREFEKIFTKGRNKITSREVFGGICTEGHFYRILANPEKVAWIVRPLEAYDKQLEAIQHRMLDRLWILSEMQLEDGNGKLSPKRVDIFLKVFDRVNARKRALVVKAPPMPRQPRALPPTPSPAPKQVVPSSIAAIKDRIVELEKMKPVQPVPPSEPSPASTGEVEVF